MRLFFSLAEHSRLAHVLDLPSGWLSDCHTTYSPTNLGLSFTNYLRAKGFDWKCLAGARVLRIDKYSARDCIDKVARTESGKFLDHNVRVNLDNICPVGPSLNVWTVSATLLLKQTSLQRFSSCFFLLIHSEAYLSVSPFLLWPPIMVCRPAMRHLSMSDSLSRSLLNS